MSSSSPDQSAATNNERAGENTAHSPTLASNRNPRLDSVCGDDIEARVKCKKSYLHRPRLIILIASYCAVTTCCVVNATSLLLSIYATGHYIPDWYPSQWVVTICTFALALHLMINALKPRRATYSTDTAEANCPQSDDSSSTSTKIARLFNFGRPDLYSRVRTHIFCLCLLFFFWSTISVSLSMTSATIYTNLVSWIIAALSFISGLLLYYRAWKLRQYYPTWGYLHIRDIDEPLGEGRLRL